MLGAEGETVTVATGIGAGAVTVKPAEPTWPSLDALMVAVPAARADTLPVPEILATFGFELCQVTLLPVRELPLASRRVAVAAVVWPMTRDDAPSDTPTLATGTGGGAMTVSDPWPEIP